MQRMSALASMTWELHADDDATTRFEALKRATDELSGERMAAPPASRVEQARAAWESYSAGGDPPSRQDMKTLCWEPDVAVSKPFLQIVSKQVPLSGRAVRGLMASNHERWKLGSRDLDKVLNRSLKALTKSRGVVAQWARHQDQLIGAYAPDVLAESCLSSRTSVTERLSTLGISTSSQFAMDAAGKLSRKVSEPRHATSAFHFALHRFFPEDNNIISPVHWGEAFGRLVTSTTLTSIAENRKLLIDLALKTRALGDPRLRVGQWQNVPAEARDLVTQWLSEEDLRFFFDLLMQDRRDQQQRRRFWIRYVNRALRSRVVIGRRDHDRLRPKLDEIRARGRTYARMGGAGGSNAHVSAFIMDFGEVTIVEFSQPNSACYIYKNDARNPYLDFTQQVFGWHELKNTKMGEYYSHSPNWHVKFGDILARYGIRPE